jgi:hypothetical protein
MKKIAIVAGLLAVAFGLCGFEGCTIDLSRTNGNQQAPADQAE